MTDACQHRVIFSTAMLSLISRSTSSTRHALIGAAAVCLCVSLLGCKRTEPPPDIIKSQREAMERAKQVGKTMQKAVDEEGKKADEEGR